MSNISEHSLKEYKIITTREDNNDIDTNKSEVVHNSLTLPNGMTKRVDRDVMTSVSYRELKRVVNPIVFDNSLIHKNNISDKLNYPITQIQSNVLPRALKPNIKHTLQNRNNNLYKSFGQGQSRSLIKKHEFQQSRQQLPIKSTPIPVKHKSTLEFYNTTQIQDLTYQPSAPSKTIDVYVSLTTTPSRFYKDEFLEVLFQLANQTVKPTKIFVSICTKYSRRFTNFNTDNNKIDRIKHIQQSIPLVEIIDVHDYGPATKLLGLIEHNNHANVLKSDDLIVVVDDDMLYSRDLVWSHLTAYQLYNCEVIAVDQDYIVRTVAPFTFYPSDIVYRDMYDGFLYGWLSFSIKFGATTEIVNFYQEIVQLFPDILYHDDLIFSMYTQQYKLYTIENRCVPLFHDLINDISLRDLYKVDPKLINSIQMSRGIATGTVPKVVRDSRTSLDAIDALRNTLLPTGETRSGLERKVFDYYKVPVYDPSKRGGFINRTHMFNILSMVPRDLRASSTVKDLELTLIPDNLHIQFTYIDDSQCLITATIFDDSMVDTIYDIGFLINGTKYATTIKVDRDESRIVSKFSHILKIQNNILMRSDDSNIFGYEVIQTAKTGKNVSRNRFYSVSAILNASPDFSYIYFDDVDADAYVYNNYSKIVFDSYNNLIPGAYRADIFRYCYLYLNGGIYIDCKKIFYGTIKDYINRGLAYTKQYNNGSTDIFVKDIPENMTYNAVMITNKLSGVVKLTLLYAVFMIVNGVYCDSSLSLTGPGCLGDAINQIYDNNYNYYYRNYIQYGKIDVDSCIIDYNSRPIIKNTYYGYYDEDNYVNTNHYHQLWRNKCIYSSDLKNMYDIKKISKISLFKNSMQL